MHNNVGDAKHMSKDLKSKKGEELNVDIAARNVKESLINSGRYPQETIEIYMDSPGFKHELNRLRKEYRAGGMSENEVRSKLRENAMQKLSKYQSKNNAHANVGEFEADRYAANKAGSKNVKKAVREAYTRQKRNDRDTVNKMNLDNNIKKKAISETNKVYQDDMKRRSKALADKSLTQKEKDNYR